MPRKSRVRGRAALIRRSSGAHMRFWRSVTLVPIERPSRSLKVAMLFLALVMTGFCPAIFVRSSTAPSSAFALSNASPTPMLRTTFVMRGTCITFVYSNSCMSCGTTSLSYCSFSLGISVNILFTMLADPHLLAFLVYAMADASWQFALGAYQHDVGQIQRRFALNNTRRNLTVASLLGTLVLLDDVHALDNHPVLFVEYTNDFTLLSEVFPGDYFYRIAFLDPFHPR